VKADVMSQAVDAIHHGVGGPAQLVVETAFEEPPDDRSAIPLCSQNVTGRSPLDAMP